MKNLEYFERVVTYDNPVKSAKLITLNHLHVAAWDTIAVGDPELRDRNFLFRALEITDKHYALRIRSTQPFPECTAKALTIRSGERLSAKVYVNPISRYTRDKNYRQVFPVPERDWTMWAMNLFERNSGAEVEGISVEFLRNIFVGKKQAAQYYRLCQVDIDLQIDDPELFSNVFLNGIGRTKAFGYGLLEISPS